MTTSMNRTITRGSQYVEHVLAHYASPYYDPVKAHAYYEEHKILSDKANKSALTSKAQRDVFAVSKENIAKAKNTEVVNAQASEQLSVKNLSESAQASLASINSTLDALITKIKTDNAPKLNKIPVSASPQVKAFLERENQAITQRAANNVNQKINEAFGQSQANQRKLVSDLSNAVQQARNSYNNSIATLNQKYQKITDTEKQNIHNKISGVNPKVSSKRKRKR